MKENTKNLITRLSSWVTLVVALLLVSITSHAQVVVFDNTHDTNSTFDAYLSPGTTYVTDTVEFGDDVLLSPASGTVLTNFTIQVFSTNLPPATAKMQLKLYANDGTNYGSNYKVPGTLLYASSAFAIGTLKTAWVSNTVKQLTFDKTHENFVVYVPSNFTWTATFTGIGSGSVGLVQYDAGDIAAIGTDYLGYWERNGGGWNYLTNNSGVAVNFGMVATNANVIAVGAAPALTVTKPTAAFKTYSAVMSINGTAKASTATDGNNRIATVKVKVVGSGVETVLPVAWGGTLAGAQPWSGSINVGAAGAVTTIFTVTDVAGISKSATNSGTFIVTNEPLTVVVNSDSSSIGTSTFKISTTPASSVVLGTTPLLGLQIEKAYKLTIVESADGSCFVSNVINSVSGLVSNRQNSIFKLPYVYNFIMKSNLTLTVNTGTNRFFDVQGIYNGLFAVASTPTISNAGWITLTLKGKTRAFTGKISIDGDAGLGFKGTFGLDGMASGTIDRTKVSKSTLSFTLAIPFNGSDTITGTIADGANWTADVLTDRQLTSGTDFNSKYTFVIPGNGIISSSLPGGDSSTTVLITNTATAFGKVTFDGSFGDDNSALKQTTYASKSGRIGLFAPGYKSGTVYKGFAWGWLSAATNTSPSLTGTSTWLKIAAAGTAYPLGFNLGDQGIVSSVYNAPGGATPNFTSAFIGLDASNGSLPTNQPPITTYGLLAYGGADYGTEQTINSVYEDIGKAKIVVNKGVTPSGVTFTTAPKNGALSIKIVTGGVPRIFKGVALQSLKQARGSFVGNPLAAESGYFIVK